MRTLSAFNKARAPHGHNRDKWVVHGMPTSLHKTALNKFHSDKGRIGETGRLEILWIPSIYKQADDQ